MSFSDINSKQRGGQAIPPRTSIGSGPAGDRDLQSLIESLQQFQRNCIKIKDKITDMRRRRNIGAADKHEVDTQIKEIREAEALLKNQVRLL